MTAENPAATATADPNAAAAPTTADTAATNTTNAEGSQVTPQDGAPSNETQNPADTKPTENAIPDTYNFIMPEGMELDAKLADSVTPILREANVSQETAQKLADAFAKHMQALSSGAGEVFEKAYAERRQLDFKEEQDDWKKAISEDAEIGGKKFDSVKGRVMQAVGNVATPAMREAFEQLGWGNHPELVRLVHRLIDYTPTEQGERPAGAGGTKTIADAMFPHLPSARS